MTRFSVQGEVTWPEVSSSYRHCLIPVDMCNLLYFGHCQWYTEVTLSVYPSKIFIAVTSAPNGWIDFKYILWLHIDEAYVIGNLSCSLISMSGTSGDMYYRTTMGATCSSFPTSLFCHF